MGLVAAAGNWSNNVMNVGTHCEKIEDNTYCTVPRDAIDLGVQRHALYHDPNTDRIIKTGSVGERDFGAWQNELRYTKEMAEAGIGPKIYEYGLESSWSPFKPDRRKRGIMTLQKFDKTLNQVETITPAIVKSVIDLIARTANLGYIYTDMKGDNIMLDKDNKAFFIDFGDFHFVHDSSIDANVREALMLMMLRGYMYEKHGMDIFENTIHEFTSLELRNATIDYLLNFNHVSDHVSSILFRRGGFYRHNVDLKDFLRWWRKQPSLEWPNPIYKNFLKEFPKGYLPIGWN